MNWYSLSFTKLRLGITSRLPFGITESIIPSLFNLSCTARLFRGEIPCIQTISIESKSTGSTSVVSFKCLKTSSSSLREGCLVSAIITSFRQTYKKIVSIPVEMNFIKNNHRDRYVLYYITIKKQLWVD